MKIACVLTTIHVPFALAVYAKAAGPDVHFFVVGDRKTPDADVLLFLETNNIPHSYFSYEQQARFGYRCHEPIGPDSIQRRNIGFLEALRWGADLVVSIDDDNLVIADCYFDQHEMPFMGPFFGLAAGDCGWFDVGQHLIPPARQRGFPQNRYPHVRYTPVTATKVGASAGVCLGDPDVSAVDRISQAPFCYGVTEFLRAGLVVHPHTWAPFNSQNTAILRQFVPAWGMVPFTNRFDDIFASLVAQRVMWEHGHVVHFGPPMILQQRNQHDLIKDLRAEIDGYDHLTRWANVLDQTVLKGKSVIEDTRRIWQTLGSAHFVPKEAVTAMLAYVDDAESVL